MFYFREGLKENTKREIVCRKIVKLSEAIPLAIQLESAASCISKVNFVKTNRWFQRFTKTKNCI
ncbi:hypothetical protein BpHYR1_050208 [Brachionus plicatilis]|uniref:Uncharacterized protein n=1 Tax=Brachionus plicatilis TaxID=10195 RepID=A0A3M7Q0L2_BRAPC|nr:hypothetical protein BpHYR1_050208 [Brachionus plicatilis]